jgi:hypothetical protein
MHEKVRGNRRDKNQARCGECDWSNKTVIVIADQSYEVVTEPTGQVACLSERFLPLSVP